MRMMKILKAMFSKDIHVLTEEELYRHEVDAAFTGYAAGITEARFAYTGTRDEKYRTVREYKGVTVQTKH